MLSSNYLQKGPLYICIYAKFDPKAAQGSEKIEIKHNEITTRYK